MVANTTIVAGRTPEPVAVNSTVGNGTLQKMLIDGPHKQVTHLAL